MSRAKILIIDDELHTREGLGRALSDDYDVSLAENGERGLDLIGSDQFDLVLTDLRMPGLDGLSFLKRLQALAEPPACILLTAYGTVENAVEAMKVGAYDYLAKPVNLDSLELLVKRALESRQLKQENRALKRELADRYALEKLIGKSAPMQEIFDTLVQIAPARSTVLITGDNGTGKELAARALHALSNRADKPFVAVHCAALASNLLETELFGHEKGAFTGAGERRVGRFEAADGGTVFLDEIGEIDAAVQVTLLRFLETRIFERVGGTKSIEVDVRLIAATNRDLTAMVAAGEFREDLYYRLDVINIRMPSLRERPDDIPLLLRHYLDIFNRENNKRIETVDPDALDLLVAYAWPGNVRELRNCIERMVVMARGNTLGMRDLPPTIRAGAHGDATALEGGAGATLDIETNERQLIVRALRNCKGNRSAAARELGISRRTLHRKINQFQLHDE